MGPAVEDGRTLQNCRIRRKVATPRGFTEHDHIGSRTLVVGNQPASEARPHRKHRKQRRRHRGDRRPLSTVPGGERRLARGIGSHVREGPCPPAPLGELVLVHLWAHFRYGTRCFRWHMLENPDKSFRILIWKRSK